MSEVVTAIGLILALEGAFYALFPDYMKRMAARVIETAGDTLRIAGLISAVVGVLLVWLVRG